MPGRLRRAAAGGARVLRLPVLRRRGVPGAGVQRRGRALEREPPALAALVAGPRGAEAARGRVAEARRSPAVRGAGRRGRA